MTKEQVWALLEIYQLLQHATDHKKQNEGFNLLHDFIEENCLKKDN
jgi:hypothetical protein